MTFLFEFINFFETEFFVIIERIFTFMNTSVYVSISTFLSSVNGPIAAVVVNQITEFIVKVIPFLDIPLWQFLLYGFDTFLIIAIIARVVNAIPFV